MTPTAKPATTVTTKTGDNVIATGEDDESRRTADEKSPTVGGSARQSAPQPRRPALPTTAATPTRSKHAQCDRTTDVVLDPDRQSNRRHPHVEQVGDKDHDANTYEQPISANESPRLA